MIFIAMCKDIGYATNIDTILSIDATSTYSRRKDYENLSRCVLLVLPPKTKTVNNYIVVMTYRFFILTMAIPMKTTTAKDDARIFVENWIVPYDIPGRLLMDTGPQFVGKIFNAVCVSMGTRLVMTSAYHRQTN